MTAARVYLDGTEVATVSRVSIDCAPIEPADVEFSATAKPEALADILAAADPAFDRAESANPHRGLVALRMHRCLVALRMRGGAYLSAETTFGAFLDGTIDATMLGPYVVGCARCGTGRIYSRATKAGGAFDRLASRHRCRRVRRLDVAIGGDL